jgi:hypothetical protein
MRNNNKLLSLAAIPVILTGLVNAESKYHRKTLVINGHSGNAMIYQIDGKSYVDLESIARISNGSLSFSSGKIVLSLPGASDAPGSPAASQEAPAGLSDDFVRAALQDVATIKEWSGTLASAVQRGVPGDGSRLTTFHDRAADQLRLAKIAASSEPDQRALRLLTNHFNLMTSWNDKLVSERKRMDTGKYSIDPNAMANDETYQKITGCSRFLNTMLPSGHFQDDRFCN